MKAFTPIKQTEIIPFHSQLKIFTDSEVDLEKGLVDTIEKHQLSKHGQAQSTRIQSLELKLKAAMMTIQTLEESTTSDDGAKPMQIFALAQIICSAFERRNYDFIADDGKEATDD